MPKTSQSKKSEGHVGSGKAARVAWKGYVNYTPTEADKRLLKDALSAGWDYQKSLEEDLLDGYKLSVTYDSYRSAFCASLYCQNADSGNAGWCITARSSNTESSIVRVLHIHHNILHRDWVGGVAENRADDTW